MTEITPPVSPSDPHDHPHDMHDPKDLHKNFVMKLRNVLLRLDDYIHLFVAFFLMTGAVVVLLHSAVTLTNLSIDSVLGLINDMLFVVIILELLWIMLSYLSRRRFPIASFIIIGIISSIRRILLIEAQSSFHSKSINNIFSHQTIDLLLYVLVVLILVFSYYLLVRTSTINDAESRQRD
uniref:Protein PsiE n=1 Tax=Leptospirillum ferriphilum TaxID=178606 RepID=A0A7C3LSY7_9BACT